MTKQQIIYSLKIREKLASDIVDSSVLSNDRPREREFACVAAMMASLTSILDILHVNNIPISDYLEMNYDE